MVDICLVYQEDVYFLTGSFLILTPYLVRGGVAVRWRNKLHGDVESLVTDSRRIYDCKLTEGVDFNSYFSLFVKKYQHYK